LKCLFTETLIISKECFSLERIRKSQIIYKIMSVVYKFLFTETSIISKECFSIEWIRKSKIMYKIMSIVYKFLFTETLIFKVKNASLYNGLQRIKKNIVYNILLTIT